MPHARDIAAKVLQQMETGDHTLDQLLSRMDHQIERLHRADRGLFHALVYGVLRWRSRLDWVIDHLAKRSGKKIDPMVRVILRMGLFQMHYLDRIPTSAAVNTSVELSKKNRRKWSSGFINGVLRTAAKSEEIPWPDPDDDPVAHLSTGHSFPQWLVARWVDQWGVDGTDAICRAMNAIPGITIRTNTLCVSRRQLLQNIQQEAHDICPTLHSPEGISLRSPKRPIVRWEAFEKGWFQVQSEAAQFVAHLLSVEPGQKVWDVCAGLGTKTAHTAQLMENRGHILATDISGRKLEQLEPEMKRLGITIVIPARMDLTRSPDSLDPCAFDRILLDAPCTGLGVLQKNPDGKWRNSPKKIRQSSQRQLQMLKSCAPYLKPGGFMVYAVCSIEPEENEQVIEGFLQKHEEFAIEHPSLDRYQKMTAFLTPEGYMKTIPHEHRMDGFFAAILKRI